MLDHEIIIVGGGMVGLGCALSLAQAGIPSAVLEARSDSVYTTRSKGFDDRSLVINPASWQFWQQLGIWSQIESYTTVIDRVHVTHQGHWGVVQFDAVELGVAHLGFVVSAQLLANHLWRQASESPLITLYSDAQLQTFLVNQNNVSLQVMRPGGEHRLSAGLLIAADGVKSQVREQLSFQKNMKPYGKSAIISHVQLAQAQECCAYERFTIDGPLALLPCGGRRWGLVWSVDDQNKEFLLSCSEGEFIDKVEQALGPRLGEVQKMGKRSSYPIIQVSVPKQVGERVVLIGNAAHAVSPVSAQGLNLAVRGIDRLTNVLKSAYQQGNDVGQLLLLQRYQEQSNADQQLTLNYTDDLMRWFAIDTPLANGIKTIGMWAIDSLPKLKQSLFQRAGGLKV